MKPFIGITMSLEEQPARNLNIIDQDYAGAVEQAGGFPVPILGIRDSIPNIVKQLDGFVFSGGDDIRPVFYKEKPLPNTRLALSPDNRILFEMELFRAVVAAKKPVLAICYGAQLVNVALGGRLYQDIGTQIRSAEGHGPSEPGEKVFHFVDILEGTLLSHIMGSPRIRVRSSHHQSVKNPGKGLRLSAVAHDGVVEALEARGKNYIIAVQWHPEKTPHDKYTKKLFRSLVDRSIR